MIFSPDEKWLAISAQKNTSDYECTNPKLRIINIVTGEVDTLFSGIDFASLTLLYWDEPGLIWYYLYQNLYKEYDLLDNKITNIEH
jgi:hypothetical protein